MKLEDQISNAKQIRDLRAKTGLSQAKFAKKYGIPRRTLEDWEAAKSKAPEYVTSWLTKIVKMEEVSMKAWIFSEYRDIRGTGSMKLFKTQQEAEDHARREWERLVESDRRSYREDPAGEYCVAEVAVEWDEDAEEWVPDTSAYTPVWDALQLEL